jgi:hypothetical protein
MKKLVDELKKIKSGDWNKNTAKKILHEWH